MPRTRRYRSDAVPEIDRVKMVHLYKEGLSCQSVGKALGYGHGCVRRWLLRQGVRIRTKGETTAARNRAEKRIPNSKLVAMYRKGMLPCHIAKEVGLAHRTVCQYLAEEGIKLSKSVGVKAAIREGRKRVACEPFKYTVDVEAFERALTPATAWLLGVIVGDGSVLRHKGVTHGLSVAGDLDVCEKAAKILGSNAPIRYMTGPCHELRVSNRRLARSLEGHGIFPAKCYTVPWPKTVTEDLAPHFVRGFLDADGWVAQVKVNSSPVIGFCSCSEQLMREVLRACRSISGSKANLCKSTPEKGKARQYRFALVTQMAFRLAAWIWGNSNDEIRGKRKFNYFLVKAQEYIDWKEESGRKLDGALVVIRPIIRELLRSL